MKLSEKNQVFEATYQQKLGVKLTHTDFIITPSEVLAREYAEAQCVHFSCDLVEFRQVAPSKVKRDNTHSVVEL